MPRESAVLARTRNELRRLGAKCVKTSGEGEPDIVCSRRGQTIVVETKQPGKRPEPLQKQRLTEWAMSGAHALWTDGEITYVVYNVSTYVELRIPSITRFLTGSPECLPEKPA